MMPVSLDTTEGITTYYFTGTSYLYVLSSRLATDVTEKHYHLQIYYSSTYFYVRVQCM